MIPFLLIIGVLSFGTAFYLYKSYRNVVPLVIEDRILHYDIEQTILFLKSFQIALND
jgi:hypothetical protein